MLKTKERKIARWGTPLSIKQASGGGTSGDAAEFGIVKVLPVNEEPLAGDEPLR